MPHPPHPPHRSPRPSTRLRRIARIALAGLLLPIASWQAHAVQDCEIEGQSVNPNNGATTAGKSGLMRCRDRDSGELVREQQLQSGVTLGVMRYYERGRLSKEYSVNEKGNRDGVSREFSPTGQVLYQTTYDNGRETGLSRSFHPNGQLRRATFHAETGERASAEFTERGQLSALRCGDKPLLAPSVDDTRMCGFPSGPSQVELFDAKGQLRSRLSFVAGKRVRAEELYDNGKTASLMELAGNQRVEQRWSSEGMKRSEVSYLVSERGSIRQREQAFSERGTLVRDQRWSPAGAALSDQSFYLNGQLRSNSVYDEGGDARTVLVTEYFDNGQRSSTGRFVAEGRYRQTPVGAHQRFDESGKLRAESNYDDRGRVTRERTWDTAGRIERDDEVFEDGSRKAFAR